MFSFNEIRDREGYYYNRHSGVILRNVYVDGVSCVDHGAENTRAASSPDVPELELLTPDPLTAIEDVRRLVAECGGNPHAAVVNRAVALQPDGSCVKEESRAA